MQEKLKRLNEPGIPAQKIVFSDTSKAKKKIEELAQQNKPQKDMEILRTLTTWIQIVQD